MKCRAENCEDEAMLAGSLCPLCHKEARKVQEYLQRIAGG
jgi:predicted hydrocarbon binding protein